MRLTITRNGETAHVEVADDRGSVTVGDRTFPVRLVSQSATRVELEIAGEKVVVDGWPDRYPRPPTPVDVDGERWTVELSVEAVAAGTAPARPPAREVAPPVPAEGGGRGTPVVPPMPGKIVELRVRDGERVRRGQILLVLEAMKMRNEVPSPADGVVRGLTVAAGANVRAREPILYVDAD